MGREFSGGGRFALAMAEVLFADLQAEKGPFFRVLHTTPRTQTGLMTIKSGEEAGPAETHDDSDQVFYIVEGAAEMKVWAEGDAAAPRHETLGPGRVVVVPAGVQHWVKSVGDVPLLFFTVYGPPAY